ncbi:hypothetical protein P3W24_05570 [Luteibacter sp. PPL201]|uniref:Uncharacterized protein n=1 Tax=Luteibacter sahnii TaxID=3021977 RepID=A0ABT6BB01_9GAMM
MKKLVFVLVAAMTSHAAVACEPPLSGAYTFDDVATGTYRSLYVPGKIIIGEAVGKTFTVEDGQGEDACPVAGRHVAFEVAPGPLRAMSFHSPYKRTTRVAFDYAKTPGVSASVFINLDGISAGSIDLGATTGHFDYEAPSGASIGSIYVVARSADTGGTMRLDNILLNDATGAAGGGR